MEWIRQDFKHSPTYMAEELFKIIHYKPDNTLKRPPV
ncbi:TetR family transcriptional regulator C-terminal domain-containing protein [Paenibacillus sp. OVF10]|nr:TetR family transcriptional regulator C-terminal domain-containing protein [Paenibacillus sp. OVF10]